MFKGKQICVVGVLGEEKTALTTKITSRKGVVVSYVTKNTLYFIGPTSSDSQAKQKAIQYGISILTVEDFNNIINEKKHNLSDESTSDHTHTPKKKKANEDTNVTPKTRVSVVPVTTVTPAKRRGNITEPLSDESVGSSSKSYVFDSSTLVHSYGMIKSTFVNRKEVSIELAKSLILQKENPKGMLPILSQHYGSGKTSLLFNFRNVLKKHNVVPNSSLKETSENLMKSALIEINLYHIPDLYAEFNALEYSNTLTLLYKAIMDGLLNVDRTILNQDDTKRLNDSINVVALLGESKFEDKHISDFKSAKTIYYFFCCWSLKNLFPLLLFFDEVSSLEEENILQLWNRIGPLMGCNTRGTVNFPGIYVAFAGKSATLTKLGRGIGVSPTPSRHLILKMLTVDNIMELINSLLILQDREDITMKNILVDHMNIGDNYEYFCKVLHEYSGGLPRLVIVSVYSIAQYCAKGANLDLSERCLIDDLFKNFKYYEPLSLIRELHEVQVISNSNSEAIRHLYHVAVIGAPVVISAQTVDLVYDLNVGIDTITDNNQLIVRLVVPKFVLLSETIPQNVQILKNIFSYGFSQLVDKGALLEILIRDTLITRALFLLKANASKTWSTIHICFSKSKILKDERIEIDTPYVRLMPKIVTKQTNSRPEQEFAEMISKPWSKQVIDEDWKKVKSTFFQGKCFIHPAPKSRSSDLFFNISPTNLIAFAAKNYVQTSFTLQMLQEEIDKCFLSMQQKTFTNVALFVFCNGIENSKLNNFCINDDCLVLQSGIHELNETTNTITKITSSFNAKFKLLRDTPICIHKYSDNHNERTIYVPNNMEVIVLGSKSISTFFTDYDINFLAQLSRNEPINYVEYFSKLFSYSNSIAF